MSSKLDAELVTKAVKELIKFDKQASNGAKKSLIDGASTSIFVQLQLAKEIGKEVLRPVRVKIPHTMFSPDTEEHTVCLFCKSEEKAAIESYLERFPFEGLTEIISLNEVSKNYKSFKDRKELFSRHSHFVCDSAIANHLYNLLGKVFREKGHLPIPLEIGSLDSKSKFIQNLSQVVNSTYIYLKSSHISIKLAHTSMPVHAIVENIIQGIEFAVEQKVQEHWKNVGSIHIKTPTSSSLPLYYKNNSEIMSLLQPKAASAPAAILSAPATTAVTAVSNSSKPSSAASVAKASKTVTAAPTPAPAPAVVASGKSNKRSAAELVSAEPASTNTSHAVASTSAAGAGSKKVKKSK